MPLPPEDVDGFFADDEAEQAAERRAIVDEANGHYPHATREQLERVSQPSIPVRCLNADEFFAAENVESLTIPALGIGAGPVNGWIGQAWSGKTISICSMGLAVATGKPLWGTWNVHRGPWLHLDYEMGRRQTKKTIHRLARGLGIIDDDLRELISDGFIRVAILPDLRLTSDQAADQFRRAFAGVRLVTCDSLRPMLGGLDENSSQVRGYIGALSSASDSSGAAVELIHHAGKTPNEGSQRTRKEMARGSSGILDEFQSMFVQSKKKGEALSLVTHEKDRALGQAVADFGLRIDDVQADGDPKWGLVVCHIDRAELTAAKPTGDARLAKAVEAVRECIRSHPGIAGTDAVRAIVGLDALLVRASVNTLCDNGEVVQRKVPGRGNGRRLYLSHAAPPEAP